MNAKITSLLAGLGLVAAMGAVHAVEPMELSAAQMDNVTAAGFPTHYQNIVIKFDAYTDVDLDDNVAIAEAGAAADGFETLTKTTTLTYTDFFSSLSASASYSATD